MVKVIKLDGKEEEFDKEKVEESIRKAITSVGGEDESLVELILAGVSEFTRGKECVLTKDLRNEIVMLLATNESSEVAKAYMMYVKESRDTIIGRRFSKIYTPKESDCNT